MHAALDTIDLTALAERVRDSLREWRPSLSIEVLTAFAVQIAMAELRPSPSLEFTHQLRVLGRGPGTRN